MATSLEYQVEGMDLRNMQQGPTLTMKQGTATASGEMFTNADLLETARTVAASLGTASGSGTNATNAIASVEKGAAQDALFGEVEWVSEEKMAGGTTSDSDAFLLTPKYVRVKTGGVLRLKQNTATASNPWLGLSVCVDGAGKVVRTPAIASNGVYAAGFVQPNNWVLSQNTISATTDDFPETVLVLKGGEQN